MDKYFKDICNPARQGFFPAVPFYENTHLIVFLTPLMQRYTALLNEVCLAAREVMLRIVKLLRSEVPAGACGTLNFMLCEAQCFTKCGVSVSFVK